MSHHDIPHNDFHPFPDIGASAISSNLARFVIVTVLLYISGTTLELWPETTKRFLWEWLVRCTPSRLIHLMEHRLNLGDQSLRSKTPVYEDNQAKSAALERIFGSDGIPLLANFRRARSLPIPLLSKSLKPPGLGNWDNSCYQNSMIQGLSSLTFFRTHVRNHLDDETRKAEMPTHVALNNILSKLNSEDNNGRTLWPSQALKSMDSWQQQDAQEYLSKLIAEVDTETSRWIKKRDLPSGLSTTTEERKSSGFQLQTNPSTSIMTDSTNLNPLEGLLVQRVGCLRCGYSEGLSMIPFNCLTLSLGESQLEYDIKDCLDDYTALEHIDGVECAKCTLLQAKVQVERCRREVETGAHSDPVMYKTWADATLAMINKALVDEDFSENTLKKQCQISQKNRVLSTKSKQIAIARPPQSLVVHINRSKFNEITGAQFKNYRPVRFQLSLDLSKWLLGASSEESDSETWNMEPSTSMLAPAQEKVAQYQKMYELKAVVTHYGKHENGHYIAYKKHSIEKVGAEGQADLGKHSDLDGYSGPWYELSDADVTEISEETLLCHNGVFMLFYEAVPWHEEFNESLDAQKALVSVESYQDLDAEDGEEIFIDRTNFSGDIERMLPTPSPTPQPNILSRYEPHLEQCASSSAELNPSVNLARSESMGNLRTPPDSDDSSSEMSNLDDSELSSSYFETQNEQRRGSAQGVTMRTAGDTNLSRTHSGKSSDNFSVTSPSIVSAV